MDRGIYPIQLLVCYSRAVGVVDAAQCREMWCWRKNWFVGDCRGVVVGVVEVDVR